MHLLNWFRRVFVALAIAAMFSATPASAQKVPEPLEQEILIKGILMSFNDASSDTDNRHKTSEHTFQAHSICPQVVRIKTTRMLIFQPLRKNASSGRLPQPSITILGAARAGASMS